jgi:hypothetical protein
MPQPRFLLEAFDLELRCPVLQAMLPIDDTEALRTILGGSADDDPGLEWIYHLDDEQLAAIAAKFNVSFDAAQLDSKDLDIILCRWRPSDQMPYLAHTRYELPLLLDGRKKLARFVEVYPPMTFDGEDQFEHWVAEGVLHREEVIEPFDAPTRTSRGHTYVGRRTVYYTPKGEEWRIPAMKLIWHAAGKSGGWNEHFERLEGMLFGYEDWQNDWWIKESIARRGGIGGAAFCCAVNAAGLAWIETAGFRALPPIEQPMAIMSYDQESETDLVAKMLSDPSHSAVVRFNMFGRDVMDLWDLRHGGPWELKAERIPEFNRLLHGSVVVIARRDGAAENDPAGSQVSAR